MTVKQNRKQAKAWMVMNDIKNVDIKNALGLNHHTQVVETLSGVRNNKMVLQYLLNKGCPAEFLYLPKSKGTKK